MKDKVVVITGASSGIGAALVEVVGSEGGRPVLAARREAELAHVATSGGADALVVVADVTRRAEVERIRDTALERWGRAVLGLTLALAVGCGGGDDDDVAAADAAASSDAAPRVDAPPGAQWRELAALPAQRQETAVVALDGKVYVLGGFDATLGVVDDVWVYDIAGDSWSEGPPLPVAAHHVNAAVVGGKIYVVGGLTGLGFAPNGFTYELTPGGDWVAKTSMPGGSERGASAVGAVGTDIYVAGGLRNGSVADVSVYDTVADSWDDSVADLPAALDHLVGGVVDDTFYVIGGRTGDIDAVTSTVYELDAIGDSWTTRAPMPTARGGTAAGVVGGVIVVVGGEGNTGATSGVFPQTEGYDPVADEWTSYQDMRTPRHGTGAAGVGNRLYVPGGADVQAFGAVATHEVFTLP